MSGSFLNTIKTVQGLNTTQQVMSISTGPLLAASNVLALQATSASYALTSSYASNTAGVFVPLSGSSLISGSLTIGEPQTTNLLTINSTLNNGQLRLAGSGSRLFWQWNNKDVWTIYADGGDQSFTFYDNLSGSIPLRLIGAFPTNNSQGGYPYLDVRGNIYFNLDNTYDIGFSTSNRPRNLYVGSLLNVGGTSNLGSSGEIFQVNGDAVLSNALTCRQNGTQVWQLEPFSTNTAILHLGGSRNLWFAPGSMTFDSDNTVDIGASTSGRPRNVYIGRSLTVTTIGGATNCITANALANTYGLLVSDNQTTLGDGQGLHSPVIALRGWYDSDPTTGVNPTTRDVTFQNQTFNDGNGSFYLTMPTGTQYQFGYQPGFIITNPNTSSVDITSTSIQWTDNLNNQNWMWFESGGDLLLQDSTAGVYVFQALHGSTRLRMWSMIDFAQDNTVDIGQSGQNRPRNLYVANSVNIGGTSNVGGASEQFINNWDARIGRNFYVNATASLASVNISNAITPTSTTDPRGNVGDVVCDDNYFYRKTSTGWKRAALSTF